MGEVYKGRDTRLGSEVAVKVSYDRFTEQFQREVQAVAALNHPHICTLHDVGPDYLVMELLDGAPLKGPLPKAEALKLACQIAEALAAADAESIVHRDLKPANIFVTRFGVKLLDFGLAQQAAPLFAGGDSTLTITNSGTRACLSPEQAQGLATDSRSDIFSLGPVLCVHRWLPGNFA